MVPPTQGVLGCKVTFNVCTTVLMESDNLDVLSSEKDMSGNHLWLQVKCHQSIECTVSWLNDSSV